MWTLWLGPTLVFVFFGACALALIGLFHEGFRTKRGLTTLAVAPFGCVTVLVAFLAALITVSNFFKQTDAEAWEEMFGFKSNLADYHTLFDAFGSGSDRAIYMRIDADDRTWRQISAIPNFGPSIMEPSSFIAQGKSRGFTWWPEVHSTSPSSGRGVCKSLRVWAADGFNSWGQFRIAECFYGGAGSVEANGRDIFVIATRLPVAD